ncbi:MAG: hypothetical protein BWK73_48785, partial [Thiothrix lacustris]
MELLETGLLRASYRTGEQCDKPAFPASPYVLTDKLKPLPSTETERLRLTLDSKSLCLSIYDKRQQRDVTKFCPGTSENNSFTLAMAKGNTEQLYGLGQEHPAPGTTDGDWLKRGKRVAGSKYGNQLVDAKGGLVGNTQFPILYALGKDATPWSLFLDNSYPQNWDFHGDPFKVGVKGGDDLRFYFRVGESLADLRRGYMQLVGK